MTFRQFFILEAFENAYANWVKTGASEEAVELSVDAFKLLKQRQILKGSEGDISSWVKKPFAEFQQFVQQKQTQFQQKNMQKQTASVADKVFENNLCLIVVPRTYEASQKYGANTKWCTASNQTDSHWNQYRKNNIKFYYIIPKDNSGKFAVAVYPYITKPITEVYNALDKLVTLKPILKKFQIPFTIFQNKFDYTHLKNSKPNNILTLTDYMDWLDAVGTTGVNDVRTDPFMIWTFTPDELNHLYTLATEYYADAIDMAIALKKANIYPDMQTKLLQNAYQDDQFEDLDSNWGDHDGGEELQQVLNNTWSKRFMMQFY